MRHVLVRPSGKPGKAGGADRSPPVGCRWNLSHIALAVRLPVSLAGFMMVRKVFYLEDFGRMGWRKMVFCFSGGTR